MSYINGKRVLYAIVNTTANGNAVNKSSETEMDNILANATEEDYGKIVKYTGETTENYEQGAYYIISEE